MSSRSLSPGGALLRKSKVFSIPAPLPRTVDISVNSQAISKTATTPCPTHLSITTPLSSLKEGDWGLKRPLPLKTTIKSSYPCVRVDAIDTVEKVTSFRSSGDHSINLLKWQELDLPITYPKLWNSDVQSTRRSVFEDDVDVLEETRESNNQIEENFTRWKYKGPWLGGQSDGEFSVYLKTHVLPRKRDFKEYLRNECAKAKTIDARNIFTSEGSEGEKPKLEAFDITDEELNFYIKELRSGGSSRLRRIIRSFLDLPPAIFEDSNETLLNLVEFMGTKNEKYDKSKNEKKKESLLISIPPWVGPLKAHPSAGLSYSRTNAHIYNHPGFGPQKIKPPVEARVIQPKSVTNSLSRQALVGIAGFVTSVPEGFLTGNTYRKGFKNTKEFTFSKFPGLMNLDPEAECGNKSWVHPTHAEIGSGSRVYITWELGDPEAVAVRTNSAHEFFKKPIPLLPNNSYWKSSNQVKKSSPTRTSNAYEYGLDSMVKPNNEVSNDRQKCKEIENLIDITEGTY